MDDKTLQAFFEHLTTRAKKLREDAGYSGSWSDGGAQKLLDQINIYRAGMNRQIPSEWKKEWTNFSNARDPEFAEYQRLQKKFGKGE